MEKERGMKKRAHCPSLSFSLIIPSTDGINDKVIADAFKEEIDVTAEASLTNYAAITRNLVSWTAYYARIINELKAHYATYAIIIFQKGKKQVSLIIIISRIIYYRIVEFPINDTPYSERRYARRRAGQFSRRG